MIMRESAEAASFQTVTGWVSSNGHFYGNDERTARYDGCTHQLCESCGVAVCFDEYVCDKCGPGDEDFYDDDETDAAKEI